jgi:hypothetical protein
MKKLFLLLMALLVSFSLLAESEEAAGDVSGNDLNPILRGLHLQFSGGLVGYVGKAGGDNAGSPIGSTLRLNFGYDIPVQDVVNIGIALSVGMLQFNAKENDADLEQNHKDSPWVEDYSPLTVGLDVDVTWMIDPRWEFGAIINFDYYALAKTYKKGSDALENKTNNGNIAVGGGLIFERYTFARHFSIGASIEFNYIVDFDGMNIIFTPFMKYTFF